MMRWKLNGKVAHLAGLTGAHGEIDEHKSGFVD